jgi:LmbE family N-acetylglucosaminyl deacetylase
MTLIDPAEVFQGVVLITIPHMDDGVLACGGTIAKLPNKEQVHLIYATDGMRSPAPVLPWCDSISPDLGEVRATEARAAMRYLGVPQENIHFLSLPDGRLKKHAETLQRLLIEQMEWIRPDHVLTPFRYDHHADHLALNQAATAVHRRYQAQLTEYFVYYRWRLLLEGDVRQYIHPQHLFAVNLEDVATQKRTALDCFKSQTTQFYAWQTRPNLTPKLLDEVSQEPECFLKYDASWAGAAIFTKSATWIRLAHRLEPFLKKKKDQGIALWCRGWHRNGKSAK